MSKYNLSELLTEVAGGRIGTLEISARDLVRKMEDLEDKGVRVERFDGLSPDGKTYIEFHVHPIRKYDEDYSFSVYDFKFGFDPMSPEHSDQEYPFSVGGRSSARDSAETTLRGGDMGFELKEAKEEPRDGVKSAAAKLGMKPSHVKENMSKKDTLKKEMMIHVDQLIDGNIDMNDFMNVVEDIMDELNPGDDFEQEEFTAIPEEDSMKEDLDDLNDDEYDDGPDGKFVNELDNTLNVDKVASPDAKAHDYGAEIKGISDEDDTEEKYAHGMVLPLEEDSIDEADNMEVVALLNNIRKHLNDKFDRKYSKSEIDLYMDSLKRDIERGEFDGVESISMEDHEEDFENYIADKSLQEHFKRFL